MKRIVKEKAAIRIEIKEARVMTDAEVESVASLLFTWWKRDYERETDEWRQNNQEKECTTKRKY